jgi:shikimate kinase / 3-dehydroquinate synthase
MNLVLAGPPGSGKTTLGAAAAQALGRPFVDGDAWIEAHWGRPVPDYFAAGQSGLFRARETEAYRTLADQPDLVIATGGGALLNPRTRAALERSGVLIGLTAPLDTLLARVEASDGPVRPLVAGDARARLSALLRDRQALYASFPNSVDTSGPLPEAVSAVLAAYEAAQGGPRFELGPTSAFYGRGLLARLPDLLAAKGLRGPFILIGDEHAAAAHAAPLAATLAAPVLTIPSGEAHKNLDTVAALYRGCLAHGLERGGTIVALGGGVAGDTAGFVAATFMRGVAWANLPSTVLAMADAGLGGKVGVDLPEGKNLVGAFHPPTVVAADFDTLTTLPREEVRAGLAEVIKSGLISDPVLFYGLADGTLDLEVAIIRAAAVKVAVVNIDPYEHGERATLNLGHTIGHGVEAASQFTLRHGEAISIGMFAEARLSEILGLAPAGLAAEIAACLQRYGLPVRCPGLAPDAIQMLMSTDKKKAGGRLRYALPRAVGDCAWGLTVEPETLAAVLEEITHA